MKLRELFRFELGYQLRRVQTWLFGAALIVISFIVIEPNFLAEAQRGDYLLNSPYVVAGGMLIGSLFWVMATAAVAGEAAARDVATGMHPLIYTAPVRTADYLGGRFLAALVLNALLLLAVPLGVLLGIYAFGEGVLARPAAYAAAYAVILLPNAFTVTAIQFTFAALSRRVVASYLGGPLLLLIAFFGALVPNRDVAQLLDPLGVMTFPDYLQAWTQVEKNTRLLGLEGVLLGNRLLWFGIALGALAFTYRRFRFAHAAAGTWWRRSKPPASTALASPPVASPPVASTPVASTPVASTPVASTPVASTRVAPATPVAVPPVHRTFGFATHARQALAIAQAACGSILKSRSSLLLLPLVALLAYLSAGEGLLQNGVPLLPRTDYVLHNLIFPEIPPAYIIVPLLILFWSGELVWREREARISAIVDAAPVPDWVRFLGNLLGLGLLLLVCLALRMAAGLLTQVSAGYADVEFGLYLKLLFGIQLTDYLLLGLLALAVHVLVNQKHIGNMVTLLAFVGFTIANATGVGHKLLLYGSDPGWAYTDMRGFGPSIGSWLWFKLYWSAWALLLAVVARLKMARWRLTRPTTWVAAAAVGVILTVGGFIFYNTNVLNTYDTATTERTERQAIPPQPRLTGTKLQVELYPERRAAAIRGTYQLMNQTAAPIDSIHLTTAADVETGQVAFDRPASRVGQQIYALATPLQPGDSLQLSFEVRVEPRGFRKDAVLPIDSAVVANGSFFTNLEWLPVVGYPTTAAAERIDFEAVVGTDGDQIAVAPGVLRRTWTEGGRRYFHYVADAPIGNEYAFFSANYAVHEARWNDVAIQIYHHPGHTANLERMVRSVQAALSYNTQQFGPYPYRYIRLIERPGHGSGLHAESGMIAYGEAFSLWNPDADPRQMDLVFATVAHEVAHQFGARYASGEGAGLLSESFAWYAALGTVRDSYGDEYLRRLLSWMHQPEPIAPVRATVPLLRANNEFLSYRKGPLALYTLSEYVGEERVNAALRRLREAHAPAAAPRAQATDLYRELQAVTPEPYQYLLHDLFAANTWWELATERATAQQTAAGTWQVTLDLRARKVVVDTEGNETPVPMDDWVEIGLFAPASDEPLYVEKHRIRSGQQTITITVPQQPARAGIDPHQLLIDWEMGDNILRVAVAQ